MTPVDRSHPNPEVACNRTIRSVVFEPRTNYVRIENEVCSAAPRSLEGTTTTHRGRCHCGLVRFEVVASSDIVAFDCNCSNCEMRRNTHFIVPEKSFRLLGGEVATYRFGTGVAAHCFCKICGISPFYRPRSNPDGYAITVHCIEQGTITSIEVRQFDGKNWDDSVESSGIRKMSAPP